MMGEADSTVDKLRATGVSMVMAPAALAGETSAEDRHIAGLLSFVEREAHVSQRKLSVELGVALGLVNTYIKRCVKKGLIKVREVPSRRYVYFLTPKGFAEKSRLTAEYLSCSFSFFRQARSECMALFETAQQRGWKSAALCGGSDLTEIAILCAAEQGIEIAAIVDAQMRKASLFGIPVIASLESLPTTPAGAIITAIHKSQDCYDATVAHLGASRVLAPAMLSIRLDGSRP